jgi:undecaprenyl phosphate-alpha-L-ara4N flippase subunit ArnE
MRAWLMLALTVLCNVAGNLLVKQFSVTREIRSVWDYLALPFVLGIAAFGIGVIFYGRALKDIPIVLAYPIQVGACILVIALFAVAVFGERIGASDAIGIALIVAGVGLLSRMA